MERQTTDQLWYKINIPYFSYEKAGIFTRIVCNRKDLSVYEYKSRRVLSVVLYKHFINIKKRNYQNTDLIYMRLVYFLFIMITLNVTPRFCKEISIISEITISH